MKRFWVLPSAALAAGFLPVLIRAAEPQTVDEVLARYVQAIGGQEKLDAVRTMRLTGRTIAPNGQESTFQMELKRPDMIRVDFTFLNQTGTQAYDGRSGWLMIPGTPSAQPLPDDMLVNVKDQAEMFGPLVDHKKRGHTIVLSGQESVAGVPAYRLQVTLSNGRQMDCFLDAASFLPLQRRERRPAPAEELLVEYSEFKDIDGIKLPHSVRQTSQGQARTVIIDKVELNAEIPAERFQSPPAPDRSAPEPTPEKP